MILRWIKSLTSNDESKMKSLIGTDHPRGIDVAQKATEYQASYKQRELEGLVKKGWPAMRREELKNKIKKRVWDKVSEATVNANEDMVEDITEKILDAAENDPFYKKVFSK